jgi:hypothetical protein
LTSIVEKIMPTLFQKTMILIMFFVHVSTAWALSTARPIPRTGAASIYAFVTAPDQLWVFAGNLSNPVARNANSHAGQVLLSSMLDQLSTQGVLIDLEKSPSNEFDSVIEQIPAHQIKLVTLSSLTSQSGVTVTLTVWSKEAAGISSLNRSPIDHPNAQSFSLYGGLLTVEIRGSEKNQATQKAATAAMKTFSPRHLWISGESAQDLSAWDAVNTSRKDRGLKIAQFLELFPDSVLAEFATNTYKALSIQGGGILPNRTPACSKEINSLFFSFRDQPQAMQLIDKAFVHSDVFELAPDSRLRHPTATVNSQVWMLSLTRSTTEQKGCFVRQVGADKITYLGSCNCIVIDQKRLK